MHEFRDTCAKKKNLLNSVPMSQGNIHCQPCDIIFHSEKDYQNHCQGKKHKSNEKFAQLHDAAKRKVFVTRINKQNASNVCLHHYFLQFGEVKQITVSKGMGSFNATIEFHELAAVTKCLAVRHHYHLQKSLVVKPYIFHPPKFEQLRMIHKQNEHEEQQKKQETHSYVINLLMAAANLTEQINQLCEKLKLTTDDEKSRVKICDDLTQLFSSYFENCSVHQFGSSINRFGTKGCDLDLFLYLSGENIAASKKPKIQFPYHNDIKTLKFNYGPLSSEQLKIVDLFDQVKLVAKLLSIKSNIYSEAMLIPSQRCPVIKFTHRPSGIKCDLSLNNRKALYNSLLLRLYGSEPRIQKLVSIVRLWAKTHGLAGGIGRGHLLTSYALTLLVLFYVMKREPRVIPLVCDLDQCVQGSYKEYIEDWECISLSPDSKLPASENTETTVELFKGFFQYFTHSINWDSDVLIMYNNSVISRNVVLQDPLYLTSKVSCMMMFDPYVRTHNVLGNVNENIKSKFLQEMNRAVELTCSWTSHDEICPSNEPWGLAALLTDRVEETANGSKCERKPQASKVQCQPDPHPAKIDGEQDNGVFCIPIQPRPETMSNEHLLLLAQQKGVGAPEMWCSLAHSMVLNILIKVFIVNVRSKEETFGSEDMSLRETGMAATASAANVVLSDDNIDMNVSSYKRTSDEASLDKMRIDEFIQSSEIIDECSSIENPMKRFCEGINNRISQFFQSCSSSDYHQNPDSGEPIQCENIKTNASNHLGTEQQLVAGIFSYSCSCKEKMWIGRSKLKKANLYKCNHVGLELEITITQLLLQEKETLNKLMQTNQQNSTQTPSNTAINISSNQNTISAIKNSKEEELQFSCTIQYRKTDSSLPHILIKLRPLPACLNNFKNFFCNFRSIATRLIVSSVLTNRHMDQL